MTLGPAAAARLRAAALLGLLGLALTARSLSLSQDHPFPVYDEPDYLELAQQFAARGGVAASVLCYWRVECRDDNRNPLYPLALSPFMGGGPGDFARAKLFGLGTALLSVLLVFVMTRRLWGEEPALLAAAFAALSPTTAYMSRYVSGDALFAALYAGTLLYLAGPADLRRRWAVWGALAGLAYLCKANGHLLFVTALACGALRHGPAFYKGRAPWAAAAVFTAVASFLLWRNARAWGNPFHHYYAPFVWLHDPHESLLLLGTPAWDEIGPLWYLRRHTLLEAAARFKDGFLATSHVFLLGLAVGPESVWPRRAAGAVLLFAAGGGAMELWKEGRRDAVAALAGTAAFFWLLFSWAVWNTPIRFVYPMTLSLAPLAALGLRRFLPRRAVLEAGVAAAALAILAAHRGGLTRTPLGLWGVSAHWAQTSRWIADNVGPEGYLYHYQSLYSPWDAGKNGLRRPFQLNRPEAEVEAFIARRGLRHILLDGRAASLHAANIRGPYDAHGPLTYLGRPRCFHDAGAPSVFLVYGDACPPPMAGPGAKRAIRL